MIRLVVLALTVLTGFTGLVYEVTWQRYLATLVGAHSQATALVLGLFLGGLSFGYAVFGVATRSLVRRAAQTGQAVRLLTAYGLVEIAIGLFALVFPVAFGWAQWASLAVPQSAGLLSSGLDTLLCALLIVPPATLMGGTIPFLTQALPRGRDDATRWHAWVYGVNTLGAFAGALAAGFWLIPAYGLVGCLRGMAVLNLLAGAVFVLADRRPQRPAAVSTPEPAARVPADDVLTAIAFCVGLAMMTVQTALVRIGASALGASQFTFSMVVAVFVLAIAVGSLLVSIPDRLPRWILVANLWGLLALLALLYAGAEHAPYAAHVLRSLFRDQPAGFHPYHVAVLAGLLVSVGPAVVLSGATLPILFHAARGSSGELGAAAGRLYAWNTVGSLAGALVGGYWAFYWLDLHQIYRLALLVVAVAAGAATAWAGVRRLVSVGLIAASAVAIVGLGAWSPERMASGLFRVRQPMPATYFGPEGFFRNFVSEPLVSYTDDPVQSVAVRERIHPDGFRDTSIATNGKSDGSLGFDYPTTALLGLLPAMLADSPRRGFVIGFGTGVTVGELAALESIERVVVAEISPGVMAAAPHFAHGNLDPLASPKVEVRMGDAYRTLLRIEGSFDVIVSEPSNPWVLGVEMLLSRELLEASREKLAPGGVHVQWMHLYETDRAALDLVLRTYLEVFEEVSLWYGTGLDLLIVGRREADPARDLERLTERFARPDYAAGLARAGIRSLPALLAHELWPSGVARAMTTPGDVHSLLHPRLSHLSARAFFTGKEVRLPSTSALEPAGIGARGSLLRRHQRALGRGLDDRELAQLAAETCRHRADECLTLLGWWIHREPESPRRARVVAGIRWNAGAEGEGALPRDQLARIAALYDPDPPWSKGEDPLEAAKRATDLFIRQYHPAAPFPRAHLDTLWRRCAAGPQQRMACEQARMRAERRLGPLAPALRERAARAP